MGSVGQDSKGTLMKFKKSNKIVAAGVVVAVLAGLGTALALESTGSNDGAAVTYADALPVLRQAAARHPGLDAISWPYSFYCYPNPAKQGTSGLLALGELNWVRLVVPSTFAMVTVMALGAAPLFQVMLRVGLVVLPDGVP